MKLSRFTFGCGDRFGREGRAQLQAFINAKDAGIDVFPVWNKSWREHKTVGSMPISVREEADAAVAAGNWKGSYFCDADHVNISTIDPFIESSDFFTFDVANEIGNPASAEAIDGFVGKRGNLVGTLAVPGIENEMTIDEAFLMGTTRKYLGAVQEAGRIYRKVLDAKGEGSFIPEVSMDETPEPQSPAELLLILAMIADEGIPAATIAPRFSGRFNKGIDYVGDPALFETEFEQDVLVIAEAIRRFDLPENLKLSVHSGSDKFAIYGPISRVVRRQDCGFHIKTAGTTWVEECAGLALADSEGLTLAKRFYREAIDRYDELVAPYVEVIDIRPSELPSPNEVDSWDGERLAASMVHDPTREEYDPQLRQLYHVAYKLAAAMGDDFLRMVEDRSEVIGPMVTKNLWERHMKPLYL